MHIKILILAIFLQVLNTQYSYGGNAKSRWNFQIPIFSSKLNQDKTIQFIFDTGSPRLLTLSKADFEKCGSNISIMGYNLTVSQSQGKYQNFSVLGMQFLTLTSCQMVKQKQSHSFTLSTFRNVITQWFLKKSAPINSIYVTDLNYTDKPKFNIPELGPVALDTGVPKFDICKDQKNQPIFLQKGLNVQGLIEIEGNFFCPQKNPSYQQFSLVGGSSYGWMASEIGFRGYNGKYEFWIKGPQFYTVSL